MLDVLVGCEESGVVRRAFADVGLSAMSCDLIESRDSSDNHFVGDVCEAIEKFQPRLAILHPPCTYIAVSGNRWYAGTEERREAVAWTNDLWRLATESCERVCLENPVGLKIEGANIQWIDPWRFGHPETKKTGLWLYRLPPISYTRTVQPTEQRVWKMAPGPDRSRDRSTTYDGVAEAMAIQWGRLLQ